MTEITATVRLKGPPPGDAAAVRARIAGAIGKITGTATGSGGGSAGGGGVATVPGVASVATAIGSAASSYSAKNTFRVRTTKAVQKVNAAFTTAVEQAAAETAAAVVSGKAKHGLAEKVEEKIEQAAVGGGHTPSRRGHSLSGSQIGALSGYQFLEHAVGYNTMKGAGLPGIIQFRNLMMATNSLSGGLLKFAGVIGALAIATKAASAVEESLKERDQAARLAPFSRGRPIEDVIDNPATDPSTFGSSIGGYRKGPDIAGGLLGWLSNARDLYRRARGLPEDPDKMGSAAVTDAKRESEFRDASTDAARKNAEYQKRVNEATQEQADRLEAENKAFGKSPRQRAVMQAQEEANAYRRQLARQPENEPVTSEQKRMQDLLDKRVDLVRKYSGELPQGGMTGQAVWSELQKRLFQYRNDADDKAATKQDKAADKQLEAANKNAGLPTHRDLVAASQAKAEATGQPQNVPKAVASRIKGGVGGTMTVPNPESLLGKQVVDDPLNNLIKGRQLAQRMQQPAVALPEGDVSGAYRRLYDKTVQAQQDRAAAKLEAAGTALNQAADKFNKSNPVQVAPSP